jgi:hypothetical protein
MIVFWDVALSGLVEIALMLAAVSTSKTSVNFYETTRRKTPDDSHLQCILIFARSVLFIY